MRRTIRFGFIVPLLIVENQLWAQDQALIAPFGKNWTNSLPSANLSFSVSPKWTNKQIATGRAREERRGRDLEEEILR